jgi:hypothetical protein
MIPIAREELAARYRARPSEDLLRALTIEPHEYTAEALELINHELSRRNCSAPQRQELLESVRRESDEEVRSFAGVRGLLAFMVFGITASSIAVLARAGSYVFQDGPSLAPWLFILIGACQGGFGLVVCALLISRNPRAPRFAATWFLLTMTISVAESLFSYLYTGQIGTYPLSTLTGSALWLSYLSTSKRVKATYEPRDAGDNDASTPNPSAWKFVERP